MNATEYKTGCYTSSQDLITLWMVSMQKEGIK